MSSEYEKGKKKGEEEEEQRRRLQPQPQAQPQAQPQLRSIQRHLFPLLIFCCIFFCCSWQVMVMSCFSKAQSKCPKISHLETARIPLFRLGVQRVFPPGFSCQQQLQVRFWGFWVFCLSKSSLPFSKHKKAPTFFSPLRSAFILINHGWNLTTICVGQKGSKFSEAKHVFSLFTCLKLAFYPPSSPWHPSAPRPQNSPKHPKDFAISSWAFFLSSLCPPPPFLMATVVTALWSCLALSWENWWPECFANLSNSMSVVKEGKCSKCSKQMTFTFHHFHPRVSIHDLYVESLAWGIDQFADSLPHLTGLATERVAKLMCHRTVLNRSWHVKGGPLHARSCHLSR